MAAVRYGPKSLMEIARRVGLFAPKNLDLYYPLLPALLLIAVVWGFRVWRRLSLAGLIALLVVTAFFAAAPFLPLIYWKRLIFVAPALLYLCIALWAAMAKRDEPTRMRIVLAVLGALSIGFGALAIGASFIEYYTLTMVWQRGWTGLAIAGTATVVAAATAIGLLRAPAPTLRALLLLVCTASVAFGVVELFAPRTTASREIGREMAAIFKDQPVVTDHLGFRFAGYFSKSPFAFMHENDTVFPEGIIEQARRTQPAYIAVSNSYRKLSELVEKELPNYVRVAHFAYVLPVTRLNTKPATIETFVYRRR